MYAAQVGQEADLDAWRLQARAALRADIAPEAIAWEDPAACGLLASKSLDEAPVLRRSPNVPARFLALAAAVLCHLDASRHALLYRILWRLTRGGETHLLAISTDEDLRRAHELAKAVQRDSHKMKAFVRFREMPGATDAFVAWFEPVHYIVDRVAPFFARRFAGMTWAIFTPYRSVFWNGAGLTFEGGRSRAEAPAYDAQEETWRTYYAHIFNPARLNPRMMQQEMPKKYWKNLPEAALLPSLIGDAEQRVRDMQDRAAVTVRRKIPTAINATSMPDDDGSLAALRRESASCRLCPLWQSVTQMVFGEGPEGARIMLVGEQPGDQEDLVGRPFVGPAGQLLDRALAQAGLDRAKVYLTNAVKHFRFERSKKIRLHKKPSATHVAACHTWLEQEIARIRPDVIVCLGSTAALSVLGRDFGFMKKRGEWQNLDRGMRAIATVHPAWVLRQRGAIEREEAFHGLVADLRLAKAAL